MRAPTGTATNGTWRATVALSMTAVASGVKPRSGTLRGLAAALPFLLELVGVVPPAYAFVDGNVTLFARAVRFAPHATLPLLFYASVSSAAMPGVFLDGVREALTTAERRLFLQAWHLRQLIPD